ncbi:probable magnesium transporter NIPA9 isoform X2 [Juglans microcarpa x Juglans regia]|uniref:probable magnesium transporter NIPA9 isoform X2 n=1 Tax=Juglans microcarpa x Juglans regia TaxID=2249226 RepID=UPI001B7E1D0D|nr:probable magnesium transporter NIPA9 isoform X2 [Juglans microcarpa x Juglans regia]
MWESIFLTLAATAGNNIGKVLQKKGTLILPPLSFKFKVIRAYAFNKTWAVGFLMDIFGALLMLRALSQAPLNFWMHIMLLLDDFLTLASFFMMSSQVSVIQPVSGCGLAILSVFSHFYLKEVMNAIDWVGITLAGIGVGAGGEEQEATVISIFHLPWLAFIVAILFVLLNGWLRIYKRQRKEQEMMEYEVVEEIIYGLESGILFGMASVISKMGFVFLEQGFHRMLVPICISISVSCSGTGFYYQTRGLKHGRAIVVATCAAVASIVTGVLAGMLALGEQLPEAPTARVSLLLGWFLIIIGVVLLVSSSRLVRHLPWPLRHLIPSGVERNFNARRSGSVRVRDSNPSAVIQAATLHHLVSSPKEKA